MRLVEEVEAGGFRLRPGVTVLPNWVVGEAPPGPGPVPTEPGQTLRIMTAGQINRNKGADHIIEMAARLRDRGIGRFSIDFYGRRRRPLLPGPRQGPGLEGHITFKGFAAPVRAGQALPHATTSSPSPPGSASPSPSPPGGHVARLRPPDVAAWRQRRVGRPRGPLPEGRADPRRLRRRRRRHHRRLGRPRADRPAGRRSSAATSTSTTRSPGSSGPWPTAARKPAGRPGRLVDEAYRMALLAEKLTRVLVQEAEDSAD